MAEWGRRRTRAVCPSREEGGQGRYGRVVKKARQGRYGRVRRIPIELSREKQTASSLK